jgi:hypothetical protein
MSHCEGRQPAPDGREALRRLSQATADAVAAHGLADGLGAFRTGLLGLAAAMEAAAQGGTAFQGSLFVLAGYLGEGTPSAVLALEADASRRQGGQPIPPARSNE